jgi:hypothetical protein
MTNAYLLQENSWWNSIRRRYFYLSVCIFVCIPFLSFCLAFCLCALFIFFYPSVYLLAFIFVCLSVCLFICLILHLPASQPSYLCLCLNVYQTFLCLSVFLCLSGLIFDYLFNIYLYLSVCLSVCAS